MKYCRPKDPPDPRQATALPVIVSTGSWSHARTSTSIAKRKREAASSGVEARGRPPTGPPNQLCRPGASSSACHSRARRGWCRSPTASKGRDQPRGDDGHILRRQPNPGRVGALSEAPAWPPLRPASCCNSDSRTFRSDRIMRRYGERRGPHAVGRRRDRPAEGMGSAQAPFQTKI